MHEELAIIQSLDRRMCLHVNALTAFQHKLGMTATKPFIVHVTYL